MNVQRLLEEKAEKFGSKPALIFNGQAISFAELKENVFKLSDALHALGVEKGSKIGICLPNCPAYVYSYLAAFCLGAVAVPLDFALKNDELVSCLGHSETSCLIFHKNDSSVQELLKKVPNIKKIVFLEDSAEKSLTYKEIIEKAKAQVLKVSIAPTDPALIMYTSGTTGSPKGVCLNYRHLNGSPEAMKHFVDLTSEDVKLCALPLSHIGGLIYIQNCLTFGITLVLMERFNPFEFLRSVDQYKVTCFHVVPAMYTAFLSIKEIEKFNLSSLRWVVVFGAPSSPDILERFHKYCLNAQLLNGWGMTETCPPNTVTPLCRERSRPFPRVNIASVGKSCPTCEIKIFDENEKEVLAGQIGEIVMRGWVVMDGYYKDSETTDSLKRNGWFHTGDLGRFDEEGFLYIVGRKKEMIKVSGQIVYAPEVEAALSKHEAVAEAAVIGVPDQMRGEAVKAFIVLRETAKITPEELRYFAREHLANFKVPQQIEIRKSLPKNRIGKIDKEILKNEPPEAANFSTPLLKGTA